MSSLSQKKGPWTIVAVCAVAVAGLIYLNQHFFFSPFAYKRCTAAYLPWAWYKNPLQLEYGVLDDDGWKFAKITDEAEIRKVFAELSRCAEEPVSGDMDISGEGAPVWFGIRRLADGAVLLSAEGIEDSPYFMVRDLATIRLNPELRDLLASRLQQARV